MCAVERTTLVIGPQATVEVKDDFEDGDKDVSNGEREQQAISCLWPRWWGIGARCRGMGAQLESVSKRMVLFVSV